ncbi:LPD7 domain-containing protein [Caballeronia sordidicola]|uniref:LPD7 domain-containing protein n=1 Tax=Caballeronia sordidicola TaxID=196367 RepID=UPI0011778D1F|nr:LPD7 domain-containing protein [Caballeronia sordidicola]
MQSEDLAFHTSYTPDQKPENTIEQRPERDMSLDAQALAFAAKRRDELGRTRQRRQDEEIVAAEKAAFAELGQEVLHTQKAPDLSDNQKAEVARVQEEATELINDPTLGTEVQRLKLANDKLRSVLDDARGESNDEVRRKNPRDTDAAKRPDVADNSKAVPAAIAQRFVQVNDKYYFQDKTHAFDDRGSKLATKHENQEVVRSLVAIAHARGWERINVKGTEEFRRSAWLEASLTGIEVSGYKPTKVERAHLENLLSRSGRENTLENASDRSQSQTAGKPGSVARDASQAVVASSNSARRTLTPDKEQAAAVADAGSSGSSSPEQSVPAAGSPALRPGVVTGKLLDHGEAHYQNDKKKELSYFVKVETPTGERTVWGVDLKRAMAEAGVQKGAKVALEKIDREPVIAKEKVFDKQGNQVGNREVDAIKNRWSVGSLDKAEAFVSGERTEVVKKHPDLAPAYGTVAAARKFAEKNFANKEDQERFVAVAQQVVSEKIAHGEAVPAPKIREARVAKKEQQAEQGQPRGVAVAPTAAVGASGNDRSLTR